MLVAGGLNHLETRFGITGRYCSGRLVQDQLKGVRRIHPSARAFAAVLEDGSVVTWGDAENGGDSSAVRDRLKNVVEIQSTYGAFAAIVEGGSVVSWGYGGEADSRAVAEELRNVTWRWQHQWHKLASMI